MFNKKVLAMAKAALNSAKAPAKKKDIIVDPRGQWDHPGEVTRVPSNDITMDGVPYPVYGVDDTGFGQMMYPGQDYTFPGNYVDEYPQMQRGGVKPYVTSDINDFKFRQAAYNDSLWLYNRYNTPLEPQRIRYVGNYSDSPVRTTRRNNAYKASSYDHWIEESPYRINYRGETGRDLPLNRSIKQTEITNYFNTRYSPLTRTTLTFPWEDYIVMRQTDNDFKKPVQPVKFVRPGEEPIITSSKENTNITPSPKTNPQLEILNLPTKPLTPINHNLPNEIIPGKTYNIGKAKSSVIVPPASTKQWVQNPATGTWYQIERPVLPTMSPKYDVNTGTFIRQTGGSGATCPDGYTYDPATNTCIPTGEFEYVDDPNDPRLEDYRMQDILYRYSQLPYKQKEYMDAVDILSGDFNTKWNWYLNNPNIPDENKVLSKNDLLGPLGSKAQVWDLSPKQLNSFINSPAFTWKPELDYDWKTEELASLMKKYPPSGYQARENYSSYPYAPAYTYNPNIPERSGLNHFIKPETEFIEDAIDRVKLKKIYPNLTDEDIDKHIFNTRRSPSYITNYRDPWDISIYNMNSIDREDQMHPSVRRITPEDIRSDAEYTNLPKKGADSYLQESETHQITYEGDYIPTWLAPKKKYILRTALPTPVIETPKEPVVQPVKEEGIKLIEEKSIPRTMRKPIQSTETYYVKGPTGQLVPKQRPVITYEEVPWTDEGVGESTKYNLETGTFEQKKGGSVKSKKYSRSIEATNRLFHENEMFKKQKSKKKKIFDPYAKYFQEGGIPYNYNPLVSNEPEGVEMPMSFDPKRTTNDPEDYQQFLDYSTTAPENRRPYENYFYGNPNEYDHDGMWDALGKPKNFNQALEMNPWWEPDPYDKMYHGFSVNPNTGVFLKSGKPGESKPGDTTWMEIAGHYLSPRAQMDTPVFDPELQRFKYIPNKEKGGFQDDVNKRRRVLEDWTYGKDIGMTYVPKAQEGIVVDKGTLPEAKVTHASPQWVQDKKKYGKDKISWWEAPFNWKKWGLNDYSDYSSFNSAFRNAREAGEKEFVYDRERYNTDLIDTKQSDLYWKSKKFLKEYYKDQPILKNELDNLKNDYLKQKHGTTWTEYYDKVKDTKDYNEWDKPRHKEIRDSLDMLDPYLLRSDDPNFLKYANKRKYQKQIKDLDNPVYFSITDIKPKDMSEDGYWDPQNNKMFMTTKADPGKLQTTYIHELSHKADDAIDLMDKVPKIDINAFNKSAFSNDFTQADFDYVSDPSEIEARKLSTLFYLSQSGKQYKPGKITQEMLDSLYDDYFDDKLPYDIEQLLALYGAQSEDLLNYLNSNYGGYKK